MDLLFPIIALWFFFSIYILLFVLILMQTDLTRFSIRYSFFSFTAFCYPGLIAQSWILYRVVTGYQESTCGISLILRRRLSRSSIPNSHFEIYFEFLLFHWTFYVHCIWKLYFELLKNIYIFYFILYYRLYFELLKKKICLFLFYIFYVLFTVDEKKIL